MTVSSAQQTTTALLAGLQDETNEAVWEEFDRRYRPIIFAYARRLGLSEDEAGDVAQDALLRFIQEYRAGKYDRQRGRLRSWIIGIVKYRVADLKRSKLSRREFRGESAIMDIPRDDELAALWEDERRRVLLRQAVDELRCGSRLNEKTVRAFEMFALEQTAAPAVAAALGIGVQDVYVAKNRVAARLREILERLERIFDDG